MLRPLVSPPGRRPAALLLTATALLILVACTSRTPAADAPSVATPAGAWAEARTAANGRLEALKAYDVAGTILVEGRPAGGGEGTSANLTFAAAARWPDRLLVSQSGTDPMLSLGTGPAASWFHYTPMRAAYVGGPQPLRRDLAAAADLELDEEHIFNFYSGLGQLLMPQDREPAEMPVAETLTIAGREIPCRVFSLPALVREAGDQNPVPGAGRWWLDPATGICLKVVSTTSILGRGGAVEQTVTYTVTQLDTAGAPADDRFVFEAPAGVRVASTLEQLSNPDSMVGLQAPDAVLTGLDGKAFKLSELRGKVVFLDLWATWCGPCKMEMPHLERLHKELGKEVAFVAASNEEQPVIEAFLQRNPYTLRIVRISAEDAQAKFKATSIPTGFVIDKEGIIRAHMVGAQSEAQLRKALSRAGIGG